MLKSERVKFIMDHLESTYPKTPIPLNNNNNFELLGVEALIQYLSVGRISWDLFIEVGILS